MSWWVDGREYHNYAEYQRALARRREADLRHLLDKIRIDPPDGTRAEDLLSDHARRARTLARHHASLRTALASQESRQADLRERLDASNDETLNALRTVEAAITAVDAELRQALESVEARIVARTDALAEELDSESAVTEAQEAGEVSATDEDLAVAEQALASIEAIRAEELQVDVEAAKHQLALARTAPQSTRTALARVAKRAALAAAGQVKRRTALLAGARASLLDEVQRLEAMLTFSDEERAEIVGDFDAPLRRGLGRLAERVKGVTTWESHERVLQTLEATLVVLGAETEALATQVQRFDELEDARHALVVEQLAPRLSKVLGQDVHLVAVDAGALGLEPVEAHFAAASGEKVDVTVQLDGSLRIHHHGHSSIGTCHDVAARMAATLPDLMALDGAPRRDAAAPPLPKPRGSFETLGSRGRGTAREGGR